MKFKFTASILILSCASFVFGQAVPDGFAESHSVDTSFFYSKKIGVVCTLSWSEDIKTRLSKSKGTNLIFNDSANNYSKMHIIYDRDAPTTISTIPVDNVIIDDSLELILCLSRKMDSPFHLVLYNFNGDLLYKKYIYLFELVLDSVSFVTFRDSFPDFFHFAYENKQITNEGHHYFVDLSYWSLLSESQQDTIKKMGWWKWSHYFPYLGPEFMGGTPYLKPYQNFYSRTDPFYEFEIKDSKPVSIILNDEFGGKVKIPIVY